MRKIIALLSKEIEKNNLSSRLNWLRAGVLGANDGIVSTAGLVMGVAGSGAGSTAILIAGTAALVAGSISMAGGEYTSVSAQKDSELAALKREEDELQSDPENELHELAWFYQEKGISRELSLEVAKELTAHDALRAHAEAELGIVPGEHVSPVAAALSSFVAFAAGSILPLLAITLPAEQYRIQATIFSVVLALALTGFVGAKIGQAKSGKAIIRNVVVSLATMGITYLVGMAFGTSIA